MWFQQAPTQSRASKNEKPKKANQQTKRYLEPGGEYRFLPVLRKPVRSADRSVIKMCLVTAGRHKEKQVVYRE